MDRDMDDFKSALLVNTRLARRTYLATYSQVELAGFPARKEIGQCIKKHFDIGSGKLRVQHWVCSWEKHQDGGDHYHVHVHNHVPLKLIGPKCWKSVKDSISSTYIQLF